MEEGPGPRKRERKTEREKVQKHLSLISIHPEKSHYSPDFYYYCHLEEQ